MASALLGGWQVSTIFRYSSALPMFFRVNGTACNVPGQFRAACIPAIVNPDAVFAQDKGDFDPAKGPLLNVNAFEPISAFNFYQGARQSDRRDVRGFAYRNQDLALVKNTRLPGNTNVQIRDSRPSTSGTGTTSLLLVPQITVSPRSTRTWRVASFGTWNRTVTDPRSIQLAARFEF